MFASPHTLLERYRFKTCTRWYVIIFSCTSLDSDPTRSPGRVERLGGLGLRFRTCSEHVLRTGTIVCRGSSEPTIYCLDSRHILSLRGCDILGPPCSFPFTSSHPALYAILHHPTPCSAVVVTPSPLACFFRHFIHIFSSTSSCPHPLVRVLSACAQSESPQLHHVDDVSPSCASRSLASPVTPIGKCPRMPSPLGEDSSTSSFTHLHWQAKMLTIAGNWGSYNRKSVQRGRNAHQFSERTS